MKRLISILLLASLLCGCAATQEPSEPQLPTEPYEKEVLPGGVWVQTDYSGYQPQEQTETKYTRLSPEFLSELEPKDDYGMLYPFVGSLTSTDYGAFDAKYGLVDENGRIVVDAVYTRVEPITYAYGYSGEPIPMLVLESTAPSEFFFGERSCALASLDGSFVTEQIYANIEAYEDYILCFYFDAQDRRMVHVFDHSGKLCADSASWPILTQAEAGAADETSPSFYYGNAYFGDTVRVSSYGSGRFTAWLPDGIYYLDWDGNPVCGPYLSGGCFIDGYAKVEKATNVYVFIDTEGNEMWDLEFSYAEDFRDGFAWGESVDGSQVLLSASEGVVLNRTGYSSSLEGSVFIVFSDNGSRYYNMSGELIYETSDDHCCSIYGDGKYLFDYDSTSVKDLKTGKSLAIDSIYWIDYFDEISRLMCFASRGREGRYCLLDEEFNILLESSDWLDCIEDPLTQKAYLYISGSIPKLCDAQGKTLFEMKATTWTVYNGRIIGYDDVGSYHYDFEGNLLFHYRYLTGNGD